MTRTLAMDPPTDILLTIKDVAEILSVSARTVARWQEQGIIPKAIHLGRTLRWRASEIQNHINARTDSASPNNG